MSNTQYMSGTGNNFIVDKYSGQKSEIEIISIVADATFDVDGVIFVEKIKDDTVKMHYFNNDGTSAEICVNGIRCVAKYSIDHSYVNTNDINVIAPIGIIKSHVEGDYVTITSDIPSYEKEKIIINDYKCVKSNIGNPHLLVEVDNVQKFDLKQFVNVVKKSEQIKSDINIEIFNQTDKKFIQARVYERGVGETNACGSGALCMFYYLYDNNRVENNSIIIYPGGELEMSIKDHKIHLKGQVTYL